MIIAALPLEIRPTFQNGKNPVNSWHIHAFDLPQARLDESWAIRPFSRMPRICRLEAILGTNSGRVVLCYLPAVETRL